VTEEDVRKFIKFLESRGLSICNFTKASNIFWPVDTDYLPQRFVESQS
jgi:hypothetical protein